MRCNYKLWIITFVLFTGMALFAQVPEKNEVIESKIKQLLAEMTVEEKVGQMTQLSLEVFSDRQGLGELTLNLDSLREGIVKYHIGSILNNGGRDNPLSKWYEIITTIQDIALKETRIKIPVIYGIDAIHGMNYATGSVLFPQSINMAATRNPELVKKGAAVCALETKACGIPWNFNPVLGMGREPLWPRHWETFGEDVYLTTTMGINYVEGQQGSSISDKESVTTCSKHYLGYSVPKNGFDRSPAIVSEQMLREVLLPPFKAAIEAGSMTVMVSSGEINGIPTHSDHYVLTEILKEEWGFTGFTVSDWVDIIRLHTRDRVADSPKEAVKMAVMAGMDMSMVPLDYSFPKLLAELVHDGDVPMSRIDDAVSRILRVKFMLGLFENPYPDKSLASKFASEESKALNLQSARESITLLKNEDDILPLSKGKKYLVTGPNADLMTTLNGGWSRTWIGDVEELYKDEKYTILDAIKDKAGADNVLYSPAYKHGEKPDCREAVKFAEEADVIIACIGEATYCEGTGNITDLSLDKHQTMVVKNLIKTGKPVVLVLTQGRPRVITEIDSLSKAVVNASLPGNQGGRAIADVLFGDYNPDGKLPFTYPRDVNGFTTYDYKGMENHRDVIFNPLYEFGHGLSYTTFEYSEIKLSQSEYAMDDKISVSVDVKNNGKSDGKIAVEMYISDRYASISPNEKRLKRFDKIFLKSGESKTVNFTLTKKDLMFVGRDDKWIVEAGDFDVLIGDKKASFKLK